MNHKHSDKLDETVVFIQRRTQNTQGSINVRLKGNNDMALLLSLCSEERGGERVMTETEGESASITDSSALRGAGAEGLSSGIYTGFGRFCEGYSRNAVSRVQRTCQRFIRD